jgi:hypothetical protein
MTKATIARHGTNVTYKRVSIPVYNQFTGVATSSETNLTIKVYPRQVVATQFNMPNMIGREVIEFYVYAPDLGVEPAKANDKIVFNSINYVVDRVREFRALGAVVLYKVLAVRD